MISVNASISDLKKSITNDLPTFHHEVANTMTQHTAEYIGHLMMVSALRLRDVTAKELEDFDLSPREFGLLNQVIAEPFMTQAKLGECLGIDRTTMVAMVDRLVGLGWLQRREDPGDRRIYRIDPTDEGIKHHALARVAVVSAEASFMKLLTKAQVKSLKQMLRLLRDD